MMDILPLLTNQWSIFWPIFATIFIINISSCENNENNASVQLTISFNNLGDFIEAIRQPLLKELATGTKNLDKNLYENLMDLTDLIREKCDHRCDELIQSFLKEIDKKFNDAKKLIEGKYEEFIDENGKKLSEESIRAKVREVILRLKIRELYILSADLITNHFIGGVREKNFDLFKWWHRYRYRVNSYVYRNGEPINEIRRGLLQYFANIKHNEFLDLAEKIKEENEILKETIVKLDEQKNDVKIVTFMNNTDVEEFDPTIELPKEKLEILMAKPAENGLPISVMVERFPIRYKLGCFAQKAFSIEHRAVKIYDIEFHFVHTAGTLLHDKYRKRKDDMERGVTFIGPIGYTAKSQWEVQQIYDQFNDFYLDENGEMKEGQFGYQKYEFYEHNCIHFARAFVDALMDGDERLKSKKWPPKILKQSHFNKKQYKGLAKKIMPIFAKQMEKKNKKN